MRIRRTIIVLGFALFALGGLFSLSLWQRVSAPFVKGQRAVELPFDQIVQVTLDFGDGVYAEVRRVQDEWLMVAPYANAHCDESRIAALLDACEGLRIESLLPSVASRSSDIPAPDAQKITLSTPTQTLSCRLGKPLPTQPDCSYMEVDRTLCVVNGSLAEHFPESPEALRTTHLLPTQSAERIVAIERRETGTPFVLLSRQPEGWMVTQPITFAVDTEEMSRVISMLTTLPIEQYIAPNRLDPDAPALTSATLSAELTPYGLDDDSALRVQVRVLGRADPIGLRLGKIVEGATNSVYALMDKHQAIVRVPRAIKGALSDAEGLFSLRNRKVFTIGEAQPEALSVTTLQGDEMSLLYTNGVWMIQKPMVCRADTLAVNELFKQLTALRADCLMAATLDANLSPRQEQHVSFTCGGKTMGFTLQPTGLLTEDTLLMRFDGNASVFTVPATNLPPALLSGFTLSLIDATMLSLSPATIRRLAVEGNTRADCIRRASAQAPWQTEMPIGASVDETKLEVWFKALADLKAEHVVAQVHTLEERASYGLDTPRLTITLDLDTADSFRKRLLLGEVNPDGTCYALIQGQPFVYLLSMEQTTLFETPFFLNEPTRQE